MAIKRGWRIRNTIRLSKGGMRMCMKKKMPDVKQPAPAPVVQTDDLTKKDEQWFTNKKRKKAGFDSTILASALNQGTGKSTLGG